METVTDFIFLGSKITADGKCSHEMKRGMLLGRKAMTNLDSILKSRDFSDTGPSSKSYGFPVVMYGCKSWTIKKAEHRITDGFWTMVLEKTLESPLDCKEIKPVNSKGNQFWIFIGRTDTEAEAAILDLMKLHLIQKTDSFWEAWHAAVHGVPKNQTWLSDWTELNWPLLAK